MLELNTRLEERKGVYMMSPRPFSVLYDGMAREADEKE